MQSSSDRHWRSSGGRWRQTRSARHGSGRGGPHGQSRAKPAGRAGTSVTGSRAERGQGDEAGPSMVPPATAWLLRPSHISTIRMAKRQTPSIDFTPRAQGWMDLQIRKLTSGGSDHLRAEADDVVKGDTIFGWHDVDVSRKNLHRVLSNDG